MLLQQETRIYYFPWFILTALEVMLLLYQAFFLVWKYSFDVSCPTIQSATQEFGYQINQQLPTSQTQCWLAQLLWFSLPTIATSTS